MLNLGSGLEVAPGWINVDASPNAMLANLPSAVLRTLYRFSGSRELVTPDEYVSRLKSHRFVHHDVTHSLPFPDESIDFIFCSHFLEHLTKLQGRTVLRESCRVLRRGSVARIAVPDLEVAIDLHARRQTERMLDEFFYRPEPGRLTQHRYLYDFPLLHDALEDAGFVDIERRAYRQGHVPDLDLLDNRPEQTLFVEARRPAAP
jgi:predicted SAM-dependent methyltransferase